ncbi:MAG: hydrogenase maturation protease [Ignavibacteriales bacterium]|nr:hydrogenase maturation protease [Ignavibacteriales bacterium]
MIDRLSTVLVLGLGNDILGDDAVGLLAARELKILFHDKVDVVEAAVSGFEIMEILEGYESVLLLDAVVTKAHPPGYILELSKEQFKNVVAISPHYMGLPEVFQLAEEMKIKFPKIIRILAMEIIPPYDIKEGLSEPIQESFPQFVETGSAILSELLAGKC